MLALDALWLAPVRVNEQRPFTGIGRSSSIAIAALDVLFFSFLKQVGSCGHTNSHGSPHFSFIGDQVEVRARRVMERGY